MEYLWTDEENIFGTKEVVISISDLYEMDVIVHEISFQLLW